MTYNVNYILLCHVCIYRLYGFRCGVVYVLCFVVFDSCVWCMVGYTHIIICLCICYRFDTYDTKR